MVKVEIHNLDIVISKLKAIGGQAPQYMTEVLERAMQNDVWPLWISHINLSDHSLEDLAKLGHPYSTRYGADSFQHPDAFVHEQTGELAQASSIKNVSLGDGSVSVQLTNTSPHYVFLRYGTQMMRMRDPGGDALREALPLIKKRFASEVRNAIVKIYAR